MTGEGGTARPTSPSGGGRAGAPSPTGARSAVSVLGIDVGSTNVKVVLAEVDVARGAVAVLAGAARATPEHPDTLVAAVLDAVARVLSGRPAPGAVGIASMAETGAPLDADGRPLTALLRWDGERGAQDAAGLAADRGAAALVAATGVRPSAKVPLVTWLWLRRTRPDLWRRTARWTGTADLVAHALTGSLVTDHTLAGRTMAYRLPAAGQPLPETWDEDLLGVVGWTPDRLPAVARPGELAGTVATRAGVDAGLAVGTPVVVAGHDHAVGTWAAGVRDPGDRADSVGTAEAVLTVVGRPVDRVVAAGHGMSVVRTLAGTHEALLAGSPAAGALVEWWTRTVLPGRSLPDVLPAAVPPGPSGVVVLPYLRGRQAPFPDPGARLRVLGPGGEDITARALEPPPAGEVPPATRRHAVALFEGLAHHARWMLDTQAEVAGAPGGAGDRPVRVLAGSAAGNRLWMGLKAAVQGDPVTLVRAAEPVATGAALLAGERAGLLEPGAVRLPGTPVADGAREQLHADAREQLHAGGREHADAGARDHADAHAVFVAAALDRPAPPGAP